MSVDLETRLRNYSDVLDAAIELALSHDVELAQPLDGEMVELSGSRTSPRRTALVVVAAAGLLVGGSLALLSDHQPSHLPAADTASESAPETTIPSFLTSTTISPDDPSLWNPIRVAPGTVGWYEFGDVPTDLVATLGAVESWTVDYTAQFYRCSNFTVDAVGPICTGLVGGNFVAPIAFAGTGELGTHLGDMSTADLLWIKAQGSLWGYDEMTSPPLPTPVAVGDHTGLMYSNNGMSYLVWEQAPGVHLWIRGTDVSVDDMVGLALTVRPATLPDQLPLRIVLDGVASSGAPSEDELVIGSHPGMPMCAQVGTSNGCVSIPPESPVSGVALVVGSDGVGGAITTVAAIFPLGSTNRLRVDLAGANSITAEPVVSPLGFKYAVYRIDNTPITGGVAVAPDGSVIATATLTTAPTGGTPTTVGYLSSPNPGKVHPEEGTYVVVDGDFPSTIAHNFNVTLQDLMNINGWTLVDGQIPEFPRPGTVVALPPGWTEPDTITGPASTTTAG